MKKIKNKMLIIELNEFCPEYLIETSKILNLSNIKRILGFNHSKTFTKETEEFQGLDPWVQWTSIHTGKTLKDHGIKRLGTESKISSEQLWNKLSNKKNLSWMIIGVMNAKKMLGDGCITFSSDPWSSSEKAFPKDLNNLLELPRYVSKNYLSLNYFKLFIKGFKSLLFFLKIDNLDITKKLTKKLYKSFFKPGINIHTLTTLFDYLLTLYFSKTKIRMEPDLSIIFLNHIAHLQHHFWSKYPYIHPQMEHGLKICDEIIGILLNSNYFDEDTEKIILLNAFKQKRSDINGIQVYRQINPKLFLNKLNIKNFKVEQNMTNDGNLIFNNPIDANKAFKILSECKLSTGEKLFFLEKISDKKLFMQLNCNHYIKEETTIISGKKVIPFYKLFKNLARTGSHISDGDIFSKNIHLPNKLENHEIHNYIFNSF